MVMTGLAKMCASVALGYTGKLTVWLVKVANDRLIDKSYKDKLLDGVVAIGEASALVANAMKDGSIDENEADAIATRAQATADKVKDLL